MAIPAILAGVGALLAPLVGGAMSLAGGALSMTGGLVHAASTATGMAWDVGKGVAGAAGGMLGGGESGNKENGQVQAQSGKMYDRASPQGKMIVAAREIAKTAPALKSSLALESAEGPVTPLVGDWKGTMLSLVKGISVNTSRIAEGMGALATSMMAQTSAQAPPSSSAIERRGASLGGQETADKGPGRISRGISSAWGKVKDSLSSVGSGLKMAFKALALGGVFLLYKKYKDNIKGWMTGIFKTFDEWAHKLESGEWSMENAWKGMKKWANEMFETVTTWIEKKTKELFNFIYDTVTEFANSILWGDKGAAAVAAENPALVSATSSLASLSAAHGNLGFMASSGETIDATDNPLTAEIRGEVNKAAKKKWASMYNMSRKSDWTIQWTDVPYMHAGLLNWDMFKSDPKTPLSIGEKVLISSILNSKPIVGGDIMAQADLSDPLLLNKKLGISEGMSKENRTGILENAAKASSLRWLEQNRKSKTSQAYGAQEFLTGKAHEILSGHILGFIGDMVEFASPDRFDLYKDADKDIEMLKQLSIGEFGAIPLSERAAILRAQGAAAKKMLENGSIFTHDTNLAKLLKPVSKAFADGKQAPPLVMAPDNRNQSVTKLGDTYSGGLSSRLQEATSRMLAYEKNLSSTTGQYA